jgi:hypothetical protein
MMALVGCGQQYSVKSATQSALIDSKVHIEGDLTDGDLNDIDQDILDESDEPIADDDSNSDPAADDSSGDGSVISDNDDSSEGSTEGDSNNDDQFSCGKNKVLVCHIPHGNPAARHNICISKQGAIHGHGLNLDSRSANSGHASDDYLGPCDSSSVASAPSAAKRK